MMLGQTLDEVRHERDALAMQLADTDRRLAELEHELAEELELARAEARAAAADGMRLAEALDRANSMLAEAHGIAERERRHRADLGFVVRLFDPPAADLVEHRSALLELVRATSLLEHRVHRSESLFVVLDKRTAACAVLGIDPTDPLGRAELA